MKHRFLITLAIAAIVLGLTAFACTKSETTTTETSATDSSATTSTNVTESDTSATTSTNAASTDTTGTATGTAATSSASATPLNDNDKKFVETAALGGLAEVSLGSSVSPKATNADVKTFADRMVTYHSKANDELKQLATTKGMTLPADTDAEHKKAADKVLASKNVDKAYMDDMVKDHDKDVKEFEEAAGKAKDPDLKAWIDKTLPVLRDHQKMAHDINGKLK